MIRGAFGGALPIVIRPLLLAVLVIAAWPATAAATPESGPWTGPPVSDARARAVVSFIVDPGSGLLQPAVRYRCGSRRGNVALGLVARTGRRFAVADRRVRLAGRFDSDFEAHGTLWITPRGRRACRLSWTASARTPPPLDELEQPVSDVEEELDLDEFDENDEPVEDEEP